MKLIIENFVLLGIFWFLLRVNQVVSLLVVKMTLIYKSRPKTDISLIKLFWSLRFMNYDRLSHSNYCRTTFLQQAFKASQCHKKMQSIMEVRNSKRERERGRDSHQEGIALGAIHPHSLWQIACLAEHNKLSIQSCKL